MRFTALTISIDGGGKRVEETVPITDLRTLEYVEKGVLINGHQVNIGVRFDPPVEVPEGQA